MSTRRAPALPPADHPTQLIRKKTSTSFKPPTGRDRILIRDLQSYEPNLIEKVSSTGFSVFNINLPVCELSDEAGSSRVPIFSHLKHLHPLDRHSRWKLGSVNQWRIQDNGSGGGLISLEPPRHYLGTVAEILGTNMRVEPIPLPPDGNGVRRNI